MSYKTFGGRSCKSCSGRPSNPPSLSNELRRLDFGSSAAAQSNQSWVKKGLRGVIIFEKKHVLFIFILFLVVSVSPRNTKLRPLTELFFKNSTAKIQPDQSPRPNGPRLMREVLPSNLLMKRLLSAWKGKKMEGMSIFLEVWSISSRQSHSCSCFSWKLVYLSIQANNTKQHIIHASQKIL